MKSDSVFDWPRSTSSTTQQFGGSIISNTLVLTSDNNQFPSGRKTNILVVARQCEFVAEDKYTCVGMQSKGSQYFRKIYVTYGKPEPDDRDDFSTMPCIV